MSRLLNLKKSAKSVIAFILSITVVLLSFTLLSSIQKVSGAGSKTLSLADFKTYYSESLKTTDPAEADTSDYWQEQSGIITRVNGLDSSSNQYTNVSILYYDTEQYRDFILEFDYFRPSGTYAAFVGFDGVLGKDWYDAKCGTMIYEKNGKSRAYGSYGENGSLAVNKFGATSNALSSYSEAKWRHLKLEISGTSIKLTVDNVLLEDTTLGSWYDGGDIFIASNINGTAFKNITLTADSIDDANQGKPSNCYYSANLSSSDPAPAKVEDYWEKDDDGTITRINSTSPGGEFADMAIYYINEELYRDFTFQFDYYNEAGNSAFLGFDSIAGKGWDDLKSGTIFWEYDGYMRVRGSSGPDGNMTDGWGNGKRLDDYSKQKWHHMKMVVRGKDINVWVDDILLYSADNFGGDWYDGGRMFIASNREGTAFKNIVLEAPPLTSNTYYSKDLNSSDPLPSNFEEYWKTEDDGSITRINSTSPGGEFKDIAFYYPDETVYRDFTVEFDYYKPKDTANNGLFFGFDSEPGKGWDDLNKGTMLWEYAGFARIRGTSPTDPTKIIDGWGNGAKLEDSSNEKWHHFKATVNETSIKVWVNDTLLMNIGNLGAHYDGGRIFIACNRQGTSFKNLTITPIDNTYTNDFSSYDSYYTENVRDNPLVSAEATTYWTERRGEIKRKLEEIGSNSSEKWNQCTYHLGNMAYLFLNGEYTNWENYTAEIDFTMGGGAWGRTFIGIGATDDVTWRKENGGVAFFVDSGGTTCFEGNITQNKDAANIESFGAALKGFNSGISHTMKIVCAGGIITFYVDDVEIRTMIQNDYLKGGRIFFATNSSGATYSNIKITQLDAGATSFEGYDEWHGKDLQYDTLDDIEEGTNWAIYDGLITRKSHSEGVTDTVNIYDMAYLYLTDKQYTNFKLDIDYKHGTNGGWLRSPVGFGAELGKHYMEENGGIICFSQPNGIVHMDGNVTTNGKFQEKVWWAQYDDDGNNLTYIEPYDQNVWHHLTLTVQDGYASIQFDDFPYIYETELPMTYTGGYLYLCSNSVGSQFKNIVIEDLSVDIDAAAQAGWQPEAEDIEFDYSFRQYEIDIADWKFNDIKFN